MAGIPNTNGPFFWKCYQRRDFMISHLLRKLIIPVDKLRALSDRFERDAITVIMIKDEEEDKNLAKFK